MFILTIDGKEDEGAYSVMDENGEQIPVPKLTYTKDTLITK